MAGPDPERALEAARDSGLITSGEPLLVLLSGGADSVCLLDVALRLDADVSALHVNYGVRDGAEDDERLCGELCEARGVPLTVEHAGAPPASGNPLAWARELRYDAAERLAEGDYAAAHTSSDEAETVIYRLATSPGRRALLGIAPRRGRLVRPLLGAAAADTRAWCEAHGLAFATDPSNADQRFARARVRDDLMPVLRSLGPAAERTIAETAAQLREENELLEALAAEALERVGTGTAVTLSALEAEPPALRRLVLRLLAERASGDRRSLSRDEVDRIMALDAGDGTRALDLGGDLRAVAEYGVLRFTRERPPEPPPAVSLAIPGRARFGEWEVEARSGGGGEEELAADEIGGEVTVRAWRDGDRMQPAGVGGTKSLQDLFTDRKVPRELRRTLPVVEVADGEIAWVAGVAVGERFRVKSSSNAEVVGLSARRTKAP